MSSAGPTPSPPPQPGTKIIIKPITSLADIPKLAEISQLALENDSMFEFRARCGAPSIYDVAMEKLSAAVNNPAKFSMFKAVAVPVNTSEGDESQDEAIVGYTQWMLGYLETPKMDPFAPKQPPTSTTFEANMTNITTSEANEKPARDVLVALEASASNDPSDDSKPYYANPDQDYSRRMGNAYIRAIRGKRHLYADWMGMEGLHRLIVHPAYQRQGIGQKLLDWGLETADRENVVSWLFARPAGSRLYERNGWKVHTTIEFPVLDENLHVQASMAMLRLPRGGRG